jgi:structural maintenance of chromosome 2
MISQHFPQSQFIIISLKEGMFNNANVLFKTQFVDGVSKVERRALKASKYSTNNQEHQEEGKKRKNKKNIEMERV